MYFQKSGKKVMGYSDACSEKEFFIARALDDFHMSPEGSMDLRGIMASTWFCRGVLDKVGIEPQVQRLGKYKSYGDILNSTSMSQEQREVVSSLLSETARYWVQVLSQTSNITKPELYGLWSEKANRDAYVCKQRGLVSGVLYKDQVEHLVQHTHRAPQLNILNQWQNNASTDAIERYRNISVFKQDFNLTNHFEIVPRRSLTNHTTTSTTKTSTSSNATSPAAFFTRLIPLKYSNPPLYPANTYLSKMRLASRILPNLPVYEATFGPRIAVINCVGSITVGESYGESLGSDSVIAQIRKAREDKDIRAVVVRIDSPGGSVLASDLVWRELRMLSKDKPVVASMADIAASGGYYFAMACDQIVADQMTVTGSIGVVTAKYNAQELARKIG
ncbi:S49 family peptidase [archaeon]|nr:MAG: S49 family peptidase [archaeon]